MKNKKIRKRIIACAMVLLSLMIVCCSVFMYLQQNSLDLLLEELKLSRSRDEIGNYSDVSVIDRTFKEQSTAIGADGNLHDEVKSMVLFTRANPYCELGSHVYSYGVLIRVERDKWGFWRLDDYNSINMLHHCSFKWEDTAYKDDEAYTEYHAVYVGRHFRDGTLTGEVYDALEKELPAKAELSVWTDEHQAYRIMISSPEQKNQDFDVMGILEQNGFVKYDDWPEPYEVPAELIVEDASKLTEEESNSILEQLEGELSRITSMVPIDQDAVDAIFAAMERLGVVRISPEEVKATHPEAYWGIEGIGFQQMITKYGMIFMMVLACFLVAYPFIIGPLWDRYRTKKNEKDREYENMRIVEKREDG